MKEATSASPAPPSRFAFRDWFDPLEEAVRGQVRWLIEPLLEEELEAALGRGRYQRGARSSGRRHGHRPRQLAVDPISCSAPSTNAGLPSGLTKTGWSISKALSARCWACSNSDSIEISTLLERQDPQTRSTRCRWGEIPNTSTCGTASWSWQASRAPTFRRSGLRSGPSDATKCSRPCARRSAATTSGASGCPCPPRQPTRKTCSGNSSSRTTRPGLASTAGFRSTTGRAGGNDQGAERIHGVLAQWVDAARVGELDQQRQQ
jgi:hypothetical protein